MDIPNEIQSMETGLFTVGKTVKELCAEAGIDYVTWWRWRNGKDAKMETWSRVQDAYASMVRT